MVRKLHFGKDQRVVLINTAGFVLSTTVGHISHIYTEAFAFLSLKHQFVCFLEKQRSEF